MVVLETEFNTGTFRPTNYVITLRTNLAFKFENLWAWSGNHGRD